MALTAADARRWLQGFEAAGRADREAKRAQGPRPEWSIALALSLIDAARAAARVACDYAGVEIRVPRAEDLLIYKLVALRARDVDDAEGLLLLHGTTMNLGRVRETVTLSRRERIIFRTLTAIHLYDVGADGRVLLAQEHRRWALWDRPAGSLEDRDLSSMDNSALVTGRLGPRLHVRAAAVGSLCCREPEVVQRFRPDL